MKLTYDERANAAYLTLRAGDEGGPAVRTEQLSPPGIKPRADTALRLDFDAEGHLLGIEFLVPEQQLLPALLAQAERPWS
jgi:uncharacterized protein YuzE